MASVSIGRTAAKTENRRGVFYPGSRFHCLPRERRIRPHSNFCEEVTMKKLLLVLTLVGLGFLAWRYFSNEPV